MIYNIKKLSSHIDSNICIFPLEIFKHLGLYTDKIYKIRIGQLFCNCFIEPGESRTNNLYFPVNIYNDLLLYENLKLNIWHKGSDILLGPVVGVFVNNRYISAIANGNPPISACKHMQANRASNCLTYFFSIDGIDWIGRKIKGFIFDQHLNKWEYRWFPLPDVVYDRGVNFLTKEKLLVRHIRQQFSYHPDVYFINSRDYLGKWQLYKCLSQYSEIKDFLPKTVKYSGFDSVMQMINQYHYVFLKSFYGSQGKEVLSIEKKENNYNIVCYKDGNKQIPLRQPDKLKKYIDNFIDGKRFIIQQGIYLIKYKGRFIDMRVLLEKNRYGAWECIYNQARLARENLTITNTSAGGDVMNYSDIVSKLSSPFCKNPFPSSVEIELAAIKIAKCIEKRFGPFGELGMDMAVDLYGKIWFIEANTKPDKNPELGLEDTKDISPQFLYVFEYAKYLKERECYYG